MKRWFCIVLGCLLLIGWKGKDPVDTLVQSLDQHGLWKNGMYPALLLPEAATGAQVIERCLKMTGFDQGHIQKYKVLKTRKVKISPDTLEYNAALVDSDLGKKILLFRYEGAHVGWWTRVYDAK